jgi:hypothetical protein
MNIGKEIIDQIDFNVQINNSQSLYDFVGDLIYSHVDKQMGWELNRQIEPITDEIFETLLLYNLENRLK